MQKSINGWLDSLGISPRFMSMIIALAIVWLTFTYLTEGTFLSSRNLYNLAVQSSVVGILSTGMVLVIVARHIDLSVGSILGVIGMTIAFLQKDIFPLDAVWNWPMSIMAGLLLGVLIGAWQGSWVAYMGVPAFIVTLAGLLMFRGGTFLITSGRTVAPLHPTYQLLGGGIDGSIGFTASWVVGLIGVIAVLILSFRARKKNVDHNFQLKPLWAEWVGIFLWSLAIVAFVMVMNSYNKPRTDIPRGIPIPVLILIVVVIVMTFISRKTRFGRHVFAYGGNPEAVELAGINVKALTLKVFVIMGVLGTIAAVIATARLNAAVNSLGNLAELNVIAAAVIGGSSLSGGKGTIPGAIMGAVIMQSLESGMVLMGVSSAMRQVIIGLVLVIAVWFDVQYNKRSK